MNVHTVGLRDPSVNASMRATAFERGRVGGSSRERGKCCKEELASCEVDPEKQASDKVYSRRGELGDPRVSSRLEGFQSAVS